MASHSILSILLFSAFIEAMDSVCKDTSTLTDDERTIVEEHNKYRQKHEDTPDLCYGVSGEDVTFTADSMSITTFTPHSTGKAFGENKGNIGQPGGYFTNSEAYTSVIKSWYDYRSSDPDEGQQVIWKSTKQVNCGYGQSALTVQSTTFYSHFIFCQYFPPGNTLAGAQDIGVVADNIGEFIPVPCEKPTVANATVTPASATLNKDEIYTVTCNEGFVVLFDESESSKNLTCNIDGSFTPSVEVKCKKADDSLAGPTGASPGSSVLSISVTVLAFLVLIFV